MTLKLGAFIKIQLRMGKGKAQIDDTLIKNI